MSKVKNVLKASVELALFVGFEWETYNGVQALKSPSNYFDSEFYTLDKLDISNNWTVLHLANKKIQEECKKEANENQLLMIEDLENSYLDIISNSDSMLFLEKLYPIAKSWNIKSVFS